MTVIKEDNTMTAPVMNYIGLGFTWFLVLMSIWGYLAILRNTGQKLLFWLFFGLAWVLFGLFYTFTITNFLPIDVWYMMALRIAGYVLIVISIISLMVHIVDRDSI
jgi:hypothetical protein